MTDPWTFGGEPTVVGLNAGTVTLVEGACFSISSPNGDIEPGGAQGLFFEDTRFLSTWRLRLDDAGVQSLACVALHPFAATFVARGLAKDGQFDSTLLVERSRFVGNGMREDIAISNLGREPAACVLGFEVEADFAHLFEVKENRPTARGVATSAIVGPSMTITHNYREASRALEIVFPVGTYVTKGLAGLNVVIPAGGTWRATLEFRLTVDGETIDLRYGANDLAEHSTPVARQRAWEQSVPRIHSADASVNTTFRQSSRDLGALRIFDPEGEGQPVIAAGAPWFMTLFGRDSLITSIMTLDVDPGLAGSTLRTLARLQGSRIDPITEEEPGKILHEVRRGLATVEDARSGSVYFGSIDSTALFVVALGELYRRGIDDALLAELLPHADRALAWIEEFGDRDGDGFVEYKRATARGLINQGWKDSFDGVSYANGKLPDAPIALCEVQGYTYAAFVARAAIALGCGDHAVEARYREKAIALKRAFNERFWMRDQGYFAVALDAEKNQVDAITSNVGHCLWSGIVDEDKATATAAVLCGSEMFSGWGIRTLATSMGRYNPVSYHNGSVWPHDSAICAAGLARYGFAAESAAVTVGLFDAATAYAGRLPELFCGFDRSTFATPIPYPASCSPQAWASAAPFLLLRETMLGFEPSVPDGVLRCHPNVPEPFGQLSVTNLIVGGSRVTIDASADDVQVRGLPEGMVLDAGPASAGGTLTVAPSGASTP